MSFTHLPYKKNACFSSLTFCSARAGGSGGSRSSSMSSQDRLIGPFPPRSLACSFSYIHSQHSEKGGRLKRMEEKHRYHYQYHHNYLPPQLPPNSYRARGWGRKEGRKNLRNFVTLSFMLIQFLTSNLERHYQLHAWP